MKTAMMYVSTMVFLFATSVFAQINTGGFSQGSQFSASSIQGAVRVYCTTGEVADYTCYDSVLDPISYDYFVGPQGVKADEVTLFCNRADGSHRERTTTYNANTGRSDDAFNLWISTIFQKSLLMQGVNKLSFQMKAAGKIVQQGAFDVTVAAGAPRSCPTTHYNSTDPVDCQSQYSVCQRYFEQYDYCR